MRRLMVFILFGSGIFGLLRSQSLDSRAPASTMETLVLPKSFIARAPRVEPISESWDEPAPEKMPTQKRRVPK
jgi:hypothetical protein